jgi:hypothetical protein
MPVRLTVTVNTSNIDGETRRAECVAAADMLERVVQKLVSTLATSGTINDRNGNAGVATWTYTPTAAV